MTTNAKIITPRHARLWYDANHLKGTLKGNYKVVERRYDCKHGSHGHESVLSENMVCLRTRLLR